MSVETTAPPARYRTSRATSICVSSNLVPSSPTKIAAFAIPATTVAVSPPVSPPIQAEIATAPVRMMKPVSPPMAALSAAFDDDRERGPR